LSRLRNISYTRRTDLTHYQPSESVRRAVGIKGISLRGRAAVVGVDQRHQALLHYPIPHRLIWKMEFAVAQRDSKRPESLWIKRGWLVAGDLAQQLAVHLYERVKPWIIGSPNLLP